ncbi:MAG: hypothetical protein HFJ52_08500 [Clostridia bacterium]|nr:hypothetical protein [Clostridia bacterium]
MAHHQALILLSINNLVNKNIFPNRFMRNPEIQAIDILLQERMPRNMLITKERKEKTKKIKYTGYNNYIEKKYTKIDAILRKSNILSNEEYLIEINDKGEGYSKHKGILINKYKETEDSSCGIFFYLRNTKTGKVWKTSYEGKEEKYEVTFAEDTAKFTKSQDGIETEAKILTASNLGCEIRSLKIKNNTEEEVELEVNTLLKPVLSKMEDDISHPAFNNLFLKYWTSKNGDILVKRNKRGAGKELYLGTNLFEEENINAKIEYEIDLSKVYEKINTGNEFESKIGLMPESCIALRRKIKIKSGKEANLNLIISVSENEEEVIKNLEYYKIPENVKREAGIARAKAEEEARYLNLSRTDLETFHLILPYIMHPNPMKSLYLENLEKKEYKQSDFWKYGISGDIPIMLVTIKSANDIYTVKEMLKVHENLRAKGINTDLILLDYEKNIYERFVKEQIIQEILNQQIGYLQNISGGIFILNANEIEDEELFKFKANIIINASKGTVQEAIKEMEEAYKARFLRYNGETINYTRELPKTQEYEQIKPNVNMEELKYYNGYGGFAPDGREYIIRTNKNLKPPVVWSNVLANEKFGTIITNNMGGFTYSKNSRLNRITAWANKPIEDIPSEIIYIKDLKDKNIWTLNSNVIPDKEDYYTFYGFGYVKNYHTSLGIIQETETFVPKEDSIKVNIIKLKNTLSEKRRLNLVYYIKPVLGEDETKSDGYIDLKLDKDKNILFAKNIYGETLSKNVYILSSEKITSYTGNKLSFIGNGDISNPNGLLRNELSNENALGTPSCMAIQIEVELEAYGEKKIVLGLGEEDKIEKIYSLAEKYEKKELAYKELLDTRDYWNNILRKIQVSTNEEIVDFMLNGWAMYQTIVCRMYARSAYYQSGGAFGFRDQLQDSLACKYISEDMLKTQILKHAKHQFEEGDVEHWWHDETKRGIRTKFSDDLLWLVYAICEYIEFTGDFSILDENVPYISGAPLNIGEDERYDLYEEGELKESIYKHAIKAIEKSLDFGEHGLPKIGSGDWNDGFSTVGNKGKGESVWLRIFPL